MLHTPGHSPGGCCLHDAAADVLFSGDTLFNGGPGATGRSFSDFGPRSSTASAPACCRCPAATVVHTGHGDDTTIGAEAAGVEAELSGDAGTG